MNGKDPGLVKTLDEMTSEATDQEKDQNASMSMLEVFQRIAVMSLFMYTSALVMYTFNYGTMQFGENAEITSCGDCGKQLKYDYRIAMEVAIGFSTIIAWVMLAKCERIVALRSLLIFLSTILISLYWYIKGWALIVVTVCIAFLASPFIVICMLYEGELYPTCYRSLGLGVATSFFNFGMTCGGFMSSYVYHENRYICFGVLHAVCAIATITAFFVPWKTKGKSLRDR